MRIVMAEIRDDVNSDTVCSYAQTLFEDERPPRCALSNNGDGVHCAGPCSAMASGAEIVFSECIAEERNAPGNNMQYIIFYASYINGIVIVLIYSIYTSEWYIPMCGRESGHNVPAGQTEPQVLPPFDVDVDVESANARVRMRKLARSRALMQTTLGRGKRRACSPTLTPRDCEYRSTANVVVAC